MRRLIIFFLMMLATTSAFAAENKSDEQKTLHAIGQTIYRSLTVFNLTPEEFEVVLTGVKDAYATKKTDVDPAAYTNKINELARSRRKAMGEKLAESGKDFLAKAAKENGATLTTSGMVFNSREEGKGESPKASDTVRVNYRGTLIDGKEFDSSYKRGKPIEFKLDSVIKCWTEGLQLMKPGGKAKLVCPANMAYGDNGAGELILPGATLIFDVELLEVKPAAPNTKPANPPVTQPKAAAPAGK